MSFYWTKADETRNHSEDFRKINYRFINELEENNRRLKVLYTGRYKNNLTLLLKTHAWEVNKERVGTINIKEMYGVEDIYHKIKMINIHIERYPYLMDIPTEERKHIQGIIATTIEEIPSWIRTIKKIYEWE
ncbi:MAG: hypothetical protein ACTSU7_04210 [Candidatus Heimdallarchaeaceae archaeon]